VQKKKDWKRVPTVETVTEGMKAGNPRKAEKKKSFVGLGTFRGARALLPANCSNG